MARPTPNAVNNILRGSLGTMPGPGGAGSIGHYTQPCRKVVLSYCASSPASAGVRDWLTKKWGAVQLAKQWPQIEWVVKEGKRGSEPHVTAHYVNSRTKTVGLHAFPSSTVSEKMHLLLSSTGRKLAGSGSTQGFNSSESRNYKKNVIETTKGMEPARGHWSQFGTERKAIGAAVDDAKKQS
ncbi:hypothetical protein BDZ90DRAFT_229561 [Jaminaea rosea]|uniref:Large ribosomal subunit protein mL43 n=1 Tax=Jaminaea rosea TaxID=1569628 RepID=A0A316UZ36_9BASI|nr:hypothetical protein BDZ90DRAFT_229561 [Jaminaea rosea]PWN30546.1 hypothetical protein BDZ90DRAFT_229561 [Jaminaea rosea]